MSQPLTEEEKLAHKKEQEIKDREAAAEKMTFHDWVEKDLFVRYNMDQKIWKAAQRTGFPYNLTLEWIIGVPLICPLVFLLYTLALYNVGGD